MSGIRGQLHPLHIGPQAVQFKALVFPKAWLGMQLAYDLAQSRDLEHKIKVKRIATA